MQLTCTHSRLAGQSSGSLAPVIREKGFLILRLAACILFILVTDVCRAGECRALIISGDPGPSPIAAERFHRWSTQWKATLTDIYGYKAENITALWSPQRTGGKTDDGQPLPLKPELAKTPPAELASLANVQSALAKLTAASTDRDQVLIVLIGNGYEQQKLSLLALPGKDFSDADAKRGLDKLKAKELIVINTAPACFEWAESLSRPGRIIICSTAERDMGNQTYFCEFLLRALTPKTNVLDVFNHASLATLQWYQNQFIHEGKTTVHGKENQEIFKALYPERDLSPGDEAAHPPDNNAQNIEGWLNRRIINEVAGLDDNGDGELSTVFSAGKQPQPLPSKTGDGEFAAKVTLGTP